MRTILLTAILLLWIRPALAQDHLIPDPSLLVDDSRYRSKVRYVFREAFERNGSPFGEPNREVTLRAIVLPSFEKEFAVGVLASPEGQEVFLLEPSTSVWATELRCLMEREEAAENGKRPTRSKRLMEALEKLRLQGPLADQNIPVQRKARPIPAELARELRSLWKEMLLGTRHVPDDEVLNGADGTTYNFSAFFAGRGEISGHVWSPQPSCRTYRLVALVHAMAGYAKGKIELKELEEKLENATKP